MNTLEIRIKITYEIVIAGRNKPCKHLDISRVRLILNSWPPELYENKVLLFKPLKIKL